VAVKSIEAQVTAKTPEREAVRDGAPTRYADPRGARSFIADQRAPPSVEVTTAVVSLPNGPLGVSGPQSVKATTTRPPCAVIEGCETEAGIGGAADVLDQVAPPSRDTLTLTFHAAYASPETASKASVPSVVPGPRIAGAVHEDPPSKER
jgi:hypothetical protein